ncbi:sodium- and chloride-dependent glycine transporter 2-like [Pollicipes pollicipes]|uniref:sodium- and chloride-dependent glycine transporter 2-like n=1 Tax=Pollicipes pollicipes TaxID=41117 RepID=UPI0018849C26|nr:sodium- and chloride-dependent glycine transporter 2-like [Pollicipes pollicipes]
MSALGFAVGLRNVWRFPYLCYQNGGGAFLVPYFIFLLVLGIPCFLLDLVLGQFSAMSPIAGYANFAPALKGFGFAMIFANAISSCNFTIVIAWCLYYLYLSMASDLPWQYCNNEYNTAACFSRNAFDACQSENANGSWWIYNHGQCIHNRSQAKQLHVNQTIPPAERVSAPEEYLERRVLKLSSGVSELGSIQWGLALAVLATWLVIFATLSKGIKSSGKVVYFTVIFPCVVLVVLFVRGITLPGAMDGISFYMSPDFSKFHDIRTWELAASQMLFSLSAGSGGLMTYASYNRFNNNVIRQLRQRRQFSNAGSSSSAGGPSSAVNSASAGSFFRAGSSAIASSSATAGSSYSAGSSAIADSSSSAGKSSKAGSSAIAGSSSTPGRPSTADSFTIAGSSAITGSSSSAGR